MEPPHNEFEDILQPEQDGMPFGYDYDTLTQMIGDNDSANVIGLSQEGMYQQLFQQDSIRNDMFSSAVNPGLINEQEHRRAMSMPYQQGQEQPNDQKTVQAQWAAMTNDVMLGAPVAKVGANSRSMTVDGAAMQQRKRKASTMTAAEATHQMFQNSRAPSVDLNVKINLDPQKRARSEPGVSLETLQEHGIDPSQLDPTVLKRIRNTDAARRSRSRRQQKVQEMEQRLEQLEARERLMTNLEDEVKQLRHWKQRVSQWIKSDKNLLFKFVKELGLDQDNQS